MLQIGLQYCWVTVRVFTTFSNLQKGLNLPFLPSPPSPCQVMPLTKWHGRQHVTINILFRWPEEGLYAKEKIRKVKYSARLFQTFSLSLFHWNAVCRKGWIYKAPPSASLANSRDFIRSLVILVVLLKPRCSMENIRDSSIPWLNKKQSQASLLGRKFTIHRPYNSKS